MEDFLISINEISLTLNRFISIRKISKDDVEKTFKEAMVKILEKQSMVLNDGRLSLEGQRVMFGALRAMKNVIDSMYISLLRAEERHENPTTAERCNEIVPFVMDVANQIARFNPYRDSNEERLDNIFNLSRTLRRKASVIGFSKSMDEELKEINLRPDEITNFIDSLSQTIENKLEM